MPLSHAQLLQLKKLLQQDLTTTLILQDTKEQLENIIASMQNDQRFDFYCALICYDKDNNPILSTQISADNINSVKLVFVEKQTNLQLDEKTCIAKIETAIQSQTLTPLAFTLGRYLLPPPPNVFSPPESYNYFGRFKIHHALAINDANILDPAKVVPKDEGHKFCLQLPPDIDLTGICKNMNKNIFYIHCTVSNPNPKTSVSNPNPKTSMDLARTNRTIQTLPDFNIIERDLFLRLFKGCIVIERIKVRTGYYLGKNISVAQLKEEEKKQLIEDFEVLNGYLTNTDPKQNKLNLSNNDLNSLVKFYLSPIELGISNYPDKQINILTQLNQLYDYLTNQADQLPSIDQSLVQLLEILGIDQSQITNKPQEAQDIDNCMFIIAQLALSVRNIHIFRFYSHITEKLGQPEEVPQLAIAQCQQLFNIQPQYKSTIQSAKDSKVNKKSLDKLRSHIKTNFFNVLTDNSLRLSQQTVEILSLLENKDTGIRLNLRESQGTKEIFHIRLMSLDFFQFNINKIRFISYRIYI